MRDDRRKAQGRWLAVAVLGGLLGGCADTDLEPPPQVVFAELDPSATPPVVPLPNDLTGQPAPPGSPAVASFSGFVDPSTVRPDTVLVLDLVAMMPLGAMAVFDPSATRLVVMPPQGGWPPGRRIAVVLRGGATGLRGAAGEPVVASPAFFFLRSPLPLSNCVVPAPNCSSATPLLPLEQAIGLEQLRQAFAPLFLGLEARGVAREDVVLAWTFTVGVPSP